MIYFILENIEKESPAKKLLEMTLIYSKKYTHTDIFTSDDNR